MHALADKHVQLWLVIGLLFCGAVVGLTVAPFLSTNEVVYDYTVELEAPDGTQVELQHGIWPELSNVDFFNEVRDQFIRQRSHFVEANLTEMELRVYREGAVVLSVPIKSKGREGSWWETPAGLYSAQAKEDEHFSSFGRVYLPYSIPFQGNFFIHGWPYYSDGTPVAEGYSGGCIRLEDEYASQVFEQVKVGMPILVFEEAREQATFSYTLEAPELTAASYLAADLDNNFLLVASDNTRVSDTDLVARLMAAVVASEYLNIEKQIIVTKRMVDGTHEGRLTVGSAYRLYDLLYPMLREGSMEATQAVAGHFGTRRFQELMETKAASLGMNNTTFGRLEGGVWHGNTTTAEDVFLFMKYLVSNRPFILTLSTNVSDIRVYGEPVFSNVSARHPLAGEAYYRGGALDGNSYAASGNAAAVALVFASSSRAMVGGTDDLITLTEFPFDGSNRSVVFVTFDSKSAEQDTRDMISFVKKMFR